MTDLDTLEPDTTGFDRRAALKKAALAAGVVAWTTPVVQAVLPGVASAAGASCTGCGFTGGLSFTGPSCGCLPTVCTFLLQCPDGPCGRDLRPHRKLRHDDCHRLHLEVLPRWCIRAWLVPERQARLPGRGDRWRGLPGISEC